MEARSKPNCTKEAFMRLFNWISRGIAVVAMLVTVGSAKAASYTFNGSSGSLSARATFVTGGGQLVITLRNNSTADALVPTDILTAIFFDTDPNTVLTPVSAVLGSGSTVLFQSQPVGGVVGGEWSYAHDITSAPLSNPEQGTSSTGLGLFSPSGNFPGPNLQGPVSVDGLQYGITSAGDNTSTGNSAVTGGFALIKDTVVFTFNAVPDSFTISNVRFLYGTSTSGPIIPGTGGSDTPPPVPDGGSTLLLLGSALVGFSILRRKISAA